MSTLVSRLLYWIPAIFVGILISTFSSHYFSSDQTASVIIPFLHRLLPTLSERQLHIAHVLVRKLAHVTEFGIFSTAVFVGVRGPRHEWRWNWAILTLLIAVSYATLDEWHQSIVPVREPRVRDVMIDSFGVLLAQLLVWFYAITHRSPANSTGLRTTSV
jgi:VanZ family protein